MSNELSKHIDELCKDLEFRSELKSKELGAKLAFQLKCLREALGLNQYQIADLLSTTQSRISQMEDPSYGKFNIQSLVKYCEALNCELLIEIKSHTNDAGLVLSESETESLGDFGVHLELRNTGGSEHDDFSPQPNAYECMSTDYQLTESPVQIHRMSNKTAA